MKSEPISTSTPEKRNGTHKKIFCYIGGYMLYTFTILLNIWRRILNPKYMRDVFGWCFSFIFTFGESNTARGKHYVKIKVLICIMGKTLAHVHGCNWWLREGTWPFFKIPPFSSKMGQASSIWRKRHLPGRNMSETAAHMTWMIWGICRPFCTNPEESKKWDRIAHDSLLCTWTVVASGSDSNSTQQF